MILLQTSDFESGQYEIAQTAETTALLQTYIDRYEESYIKRILGVELGQKFIDDIKGEDSDSSAIEARFQVILDPFIKQQDNDGDVIWESKGMKDILMAFVYYEYVAETQVTHTQSGITLNQSEVSTTMSSQNAARKGEQKWNFALHSVDAIQWWCGCEDKANYPEYSGIHIRPQYSELL